MLASLLIGVCLGLPVGAGLYYLLSHLQERADLARERRQEARMWEHKGQAWRAWEAFKREMAGR